MSIAQLCVLGGFVVGVLFIFACFGYVAGDTIRIRGLYTAGGRRKVATFMERHNDAVIPQIIGVSCILTPAGITTEQMLLVITGPLAIAATVVFREVREWAIARVLADRERLARLS